MPSPIPLPLLRLHYYDAAQEYLKSLPPEHFMEATPQAAQRKITLESLDLVHARRPEVQVFNELLVQYPRPGQKKPGQVVPDNMVVLHEQPIQAEGSYDVPLQPARPFWVLEYVSKRSWRKDYDQNREKYEKELKVPYYLLFVPESEEMVLWRHNRQRYVTVKPNGQGRVPIAKLDLELGLLDGWVRFWFHGELLPLPADLLHQMDQLKREIKQLKRQLAQAERDTEAERQARLAAEAELARLKAQLHQQPRTAD